MLMSEEIVSFKIPFYDTQPHYGSQNYNVNIIILKNVTYDFITR